MKENQENIELIAKVITGEASKDEIEMLNTWLEEHPENHNKFEDYKKVHELANKEESEFLIDTNAEWDKFLDSINQQEPLYRRNWLKIAASLLLLAIAAYFGFNVLFNQNITRYASENVVRELQLPDGSQVTLNKNSEISFDKEFGVSHRNLKISGEAFFDVVSNKKIPFKISTGISEIEVVGTSFNVKAYKNNPSEKVTVSTGQVKFYSNQQASILLGPGEVGVFHKASTSLSKIDNNDKNFLAWKTRKFVFENSDLKSVIDALNNVYNNKIEISTTINETCQVTVTFENQSLESILNVLKSTLNLIFEADGNKIVITSAEC